MQLQVILLLAILGFVNAYFLHWQFVRFQKFKKKMFCLLGEDCAGVIGSVYGTTMGVKNEVIGIWYYTIVATLALALMLFPDTTLIRDLIVLITLISTAFSMFLLYAQTNILKNLCSWCLIAIVLNIIMFISALKLIV